MKKEGVLGSKKDREGLRPRRASYEFLKDVLRMLIDTDTIRDVVFVMMVTMELLVIIHVLEE